LAKEAAKGFAEDFCKDSLKSVFSGRGDGAEAAAKALKEFLYEFEQELVGADLNEAEQKGYAESLKQFTKEPEVRKTIGAALVDMNQSVDFKTLAEKWDALGLKRLPDDFSWAKLCRRYQNKARSILNEFDELREALKAENAQDTRDAAERLAGLAPGFDTSRYRDGLLKRYQNLKLESLDSGGAIHNPIHLTRIFVEQNVRDCQQFNPRIHELPKDRLSALRDRGMAKNELSEAKMERLRRDYFDQSARGVLEALRSSEERLFVVLGDPGSGKSVLLEYLALVWANLTTIERDKASLPLLVELKAYARHRENCKSLLEYFHQAPDGCGQLDQHELHQLLERDGGWFLLDGLDEIFDEAVRASVVQEIVNLSTRYPEARFVVTSRVIGYQQQKLSDAHFRHFMLQDLEPKQIEDFIQRWHDLAYADEAERVHKRERLRKAVNNSRPIKELAQNPLMLTMMALLNRHQPLPDDRVDLYEQTSRLLLHQWDAEKALPGGEDLPLYHKQAMLRAIAYKMQTNPGGLAGNAIAVHELEDTLAQYLQEQGFSEPRRTAANLIEQLRERNFILCVLGDDLFAFVHRTFLEYFCASAFLWKFEKERTLTLEELQAQTFDAHWQDEKWHEVLRLITGQIAIGNPEHAAQLIQSLMIKENVDNEFIPFILAAGCLGEVRNRGAIGALDAQLLDELKNLSVLKPPKEGGDERRRVYQRNARAVQVISLTWSATPTIAQWLREIAIQQNEGMRCLALNILARDWSDEPHTLPFLQERTTKDEYWLARHILMENLHRHWLDDPTTISIIQDRAQNDEDDTVRLSAAMRLNYGWPNNSAVQAFLAELKKEQPDLFDE
jgi:predicted NACHT family NTPase